MAAPLQPRDTFESANRILGDQATKVGSSFNSGQNQSFNAASFPSQSGFGTRQSRVPNNRLATTKRKLIRWLVPEMPIVEMYINPASIIYNHTKQIAEQRTKSGFSLQYWGENLISLTIQGTTGTSGIEGINVLHDVYRNEQLAYDPYALALQAERDRQEQSDLDFDLFGGNLSAGSLIGGLGGIVSDAAGSILGSAASILSPQRNSTGINRSAPSLASLAFCVEMYWSGEVHRGYFKSMQVTESAQNLGFFDYTIEFKATQKRGFRQNYLGWHRSATSGPSNSNTIYGTPHSYAGLTDGAVTPRQNNVDQPDLNSPFVDVGNSIVKSVSSIGKSIINAFDI